MSNDRGSHSPAIRRRIVTTAGKISALLAATPAWLRSLLGIVLPSLAIISFFVLLMFSLLHLSSIQRTMRLEAPHNMLWVVSQAHVASLRLSNTINNIALGDDNLAQLQRRYNVFLSRIYLMRQTPQRRQLRRFGMTDALDQLHQKLPRLESHIQALQPHGIDDAAVIKPILDKYNAVLNRTATKAMITEWDDLGGKLAAGRNEIHWIILSLGGILLAGFVLIGDLVWAGHRARRRTQLLNREKAFSQLVIGSSGEGIIAVDLQRQCTIWNRAAETLFRRPAGAVIGKALASVSGFFQVDRFDKALTRALSGETVELPDQPFFPNAQATARYIDVKCYPLRGSGGIIGSVVLLFDVTERRAAQREIALHRDHLEELIEARTGELNASLERERAAAELYRNFGAMISHQFRTPLAIVDSALQRLVRRGDRLTLTEIRQRSSKARDAIRRLIQLIESTLDAARLDAGQVSTRSQPCNLHQLATGICASQRETSGRDIQLHAPHAAAVIVLCDRTHAEHIITNLVSNAVKYGAPGTPIHVSVSARGGHGECAVSNAGAIATDTNPDTLFQQYYRGDNAQGHTGIGIGLYMARALARLQDGDVWLDTSKAGAVTFVLQLPSSAAISVLRKGATAQAQ